MDFTVSIYERRTGQGQLCWTTLCLGPLTVEVEGRSEVKLRRRLLEELRKKIDKVKPEELIWLQGRRGLSLRRVRVDLSLQDEAEGRRKVTGVFPLVLEPRWTDQDGRVLLVHHPQHQDRWFSLADEEVDDELLTRQASRWLSGVWGGLSDRQLHQLTSDGKDRLKVVSFSASPPSLQERLPERDRGVWDDLEAPLFKDRRRPREGGFKVLGELGVDLTLQAAEGSLPAGSPRSPYRERLLLLLGGRLKRPTLVVGPPQVGKTTLLHRWVHDLLDADGYPAHRNLDRVHHVWAVSGRRIISGMSYLGDWEQRCLDLLQDVAGRQVVLLVDDLHAFSRLGRSRDSDRNLAELFCGPLQRGEVLMVGECTPGRLQRMEEDAPSLAALFSRVFVEPTGEAETLSLMQQELRQLEADERVSIHPLLPRQIIRMATSLARGAALPGMALELLRTLARQAASTDPEAPEVPLESADLIKLVSRRTGLPEMLLHPDEPVDLARVRRALERRVMGQPEALDAACDLVLRIAAGLCDPGRPYAVYLFTGPTGTGKTELARSLAAALYGGPERLVRFDMSEYSGPDGAARLAGDQLQPRGALVEPLLREPFCVVLLDEIEKAHPSVLNLLLQLFDEGRLTDAAGDTADFTHAVVLMTSNLGARSQEPIGFSDSEEAVLAEVNRAVREFFAPELFNRMDRVVPFRPLSPGTARAIAAKELGRLLSRRGLLDRRIFVHTTDGVLDRVVARGFDPRYGARTLKRYLEQHVAALLADEISGSPPALLRVFRLHVPAPGQAPMPCAVAQGQGGGDDIALHAESLTEARPDDAVQDLPLEPLLAEAAGELRGRLPAAMAFVDELLDGEELARVAARIRYHLARYDAGEPDHAEDLYNLERMRLSLRGLRGRLAYLHGKAGSRRPEILAALAEATFLRRALTRVEDPSQHAVLVELLPLTGLAAAWADGAALQGAGPGLMASLARAYVGQQQGLGPRCELEDLAWVGEDQRVHREEPGRGEQGLELLDRVLGAPVSLLVLRLVGLGVLDLFSGESGCHLHRSLGSGSEVLRVRVLPAPGDTSAAGAAVEHLEASRRFAGALEQGLSPLPDNPAGLLPLVREYRFDAPRAAGRSAPLELVDHGLGYAASLHARTLHEGLEVLWLLRMSRQERGEG